VSKALRVRLTVGLCAVAAAGVVAGVVYATRQDPPQPAAQCKKRPVPYVLSNVTSENHSAVVAAMEHPPREAARILEPLARANRRDPEVQFNFGTTLFCAGYVGEAEQAFRQAKAAGRNTYYEIQADVILHPQFFSRGYPIFEPLGSNTLLEQGVLQQRLGHQHTAERLYQRAARQSPGDAQAQVAAAVGRFDMDDLSASFSRLGPLVKRFPKSQSVRYHLGLLLAWTGQRDQAIAEFRQARTLGPRTTLGKHAESFLAGLVTGGTNGAGR
jgi:tetratricopeptide (TPR) repeat protein